VEQQGEEQKGRWCPRKEVRVKTTPCNVETDTSREKVIGVDKNIFLEMGTVFVSISRI
jgi:hypothetical protein